MIFEEFLIGFGRHLGSQIDIKIDEKVYKKSSLIFNGFLKKNGGKTEARGSPNGDQNGRISWTFRNLLPEALPGRVLDGFGEDFERVLEGFGSPGRPKWT